MVYAKVDDCANDAFLRPSLPEGEWSIHTSLTLTKYSKRRMSRMRITKMYGKRFLISYII